jgi:predicted metal-dependent hydrolase
MPLPANTTSLSDHPEWFRVGDEILPLVITRNYRAKRICLRYNPSDHAINLTLPRHTRTSEGLRFLNQKSEWLMNVLREMPCKKQIKPGVVVPIFGERVRIRHDETMRCAWMLKDNQLIISGKREHFQRRVMEAIRKMSKNHLNELAHYQAGCIGKKVSRLSVRDTKSRWGSCSSTGNLSFSWRLIFAPYEVLQYVVAHEVAHLRHMNHSPRFWETCAEILPEYEPAKAWLRVHGKELYRFNA